MNEAIKTEGLTKRYRGFALEGLDLTLPRGVIMGLIGENGAGKSTAIKTMLDVVHKDGGRVTLLGRDAERDLSLTKEEIGVVPDEVGIPGQLSAYEVGRIMQRTYKNWDADAYRRHIDALGLPPKKKFSTYSRGMKMKLGIAVALSHGAKLLILDEATSGLDPVVRDEVTDMFRDFTRDEECSVLISSHIVSDLEKICDYIAFLHGGRLILCEEKDRMLEKYCILRGEPADIEAARVRGAVVGERRGTYGCEALAVRELLPAGCGAVGDAGIEDIFIYTVKGESVK